MTSKKLVIFAAFALGCVGLPLYAGLVSLQPAYTDARFQPVDAFHAECTQDAQISVAIPDKNVSQMHLVLQYVPEDLQILRVVGAGQTNANYQMEYNSVIFDIDNPVLTDQSALLTLSIQSNSGVTSTNIVVDSGSYYVVKGKKIFFTETLPLSFASVPECDPDIIPPSVNLIFPQDPEARLSLDQYFVFEIKDAGKGIDKNSIKIFLNDQVYTVDSDNVKWKGNFMTFYPQDRLPVNKKIDLKVTIDDLQSYGGPNETDKSFGFKTATGMALLDNITPMMFRQLSREGAKFAGTTDECALLQNFYARSDVSFQAGLMPILEKLSCDLSALTTDDTLAATHDAAPVKNKNLNFVSVFAVLGRILFVIALVLKFHYMASYKKHKRLAIMYKNSV